MNKLGVARHSGPLVVGAGLAGLTAALHLAERGCTPLLIEAHPTLLGGRVRGGPTVEIEHRGQRWSFRGEHGVHGIWNNYVNFKAMLARHGLTPPFIAANNETWFHLQAGEVRQADVGRTIRRSFVPAPFHSFALLFNLGFWRMLGLWDWLRLPIIAGSLLLPALSIDPLREEQALAELTLADIMSHWPARPRGLIAALLRNGLASTPEDIPLASAIAFLRFYTLLRRDAWEFSYLPGDSQTYLIGPLVERYRALGGELWPATTIEQVAQTDAGWELRYRQAQQLGTLHTTNLILATDPPATEHLLRSSPTTAKEAAQLRWPGGQSTVIARFWFDRQPRRAAEAGICSGDFTLDNIFWLEQIYDDYRKWHGVTGGSAAEVHVYGPPDRLALPDAVLHTLITNDLFRIYPELHGSLLHTILIRNPATHTRFGVGTSQEHLGVVTPWPHLWACGDWVRDPAPAMFLERACVTGLHAANALLAAEGLEPFPVAPYPPAEPFAGWMEGRFRGVRRRLRQLRKARPMGGR